MEGSLIRLRRVTVSDTADRVRWFQNPNVTRYLGSGFLLRSEPEVRSYLESCAAGTEKGIELAIEVKATGQHAGGCTLRNFEQVPRKCEFAIMIDEPHWGKGYGSEAARLMARLAFEQLNMNKVYLTVYAPNAGAVKSYEKAGFVQEGLLREHGFIEGRYVDAYYMASLRKDWEQLKEAGRA